ncbi:hypothetical protein ABZ329_29470 [Streptomyces rubiginosohelvolus]|uniref:hypothetical protein n=1 Tax=Streptomyces rubiginosohelvolus TaxID=67362 RepID=UPI0033E3C972
MIARRPVTIALAALLASASNRPVGRGKKPPGNPQHYYILYSLDTTLDGSPLTDENEDLSPVYQVTSVSAPDPKRPDSSGDPDQVEWMADKARETFLGRHPGTGLWLHPIVIAGVSVMGRSLDVEAGGSSDPPDAIMSYVQRFRFDLTPA